MSRVKAVAYLRVSQEGENIENQKLKILEFAEKKNMEIVGFFADIDVSGTTPPRQRPQYQAMLSFCRLNGIKTIVFYDLSRLARSVEEGLEELKRLAEEGFNVYFAGMDFLNYDIDPMLKKKIIMDFLWFAELYVQDVKKRTTVAMERLQREGRLYHRPRLIHYVAAYITGKSLNEITRKDLEEARTYLKRLFEPYLRAGTPYRRLHAVFLETFAKMFQRFPRASKGYTAFRNLIRDVFGI